MEVANNVRGVLDGVSRKMKDVSIAAPRTSQEGELDAWVNINSDEVDSCASSDWSSPESSPPSSPRAAPHEPRANAKGRAQSSKVPIAADGKHSGYAAAVQSKLAPVTPDSSPSGLKAAAAAFTPAKAEVAVENGKAAPGAVQPQAAVPPKDDAPKPDFDLSADYYSAQLDAVQELSKDRTFKVTLHITNAHAKLLQMFIGEYEGKALLQAFNGWKWQQQGCKRPLTYDFMKNAAEALGRKVAFVRISASERGVFYARAHFEPAPGGRADDASVFGVDSRPSDALNLAVRFGAPVYVHRQLVSDTC